MAILELYGALHRCGVAHNDVVIRHLRLQFSNGMPADLGLRLIDFEASKVADERQLEAEMRHVATLLRGGLSEWDSTSLCISS